MRKEKGAGCLLCSGGVAIEGDVSENPQVDSDPYLALKRRSSGKKKLKFVVMLCRWEGKQVMWKGTTSSGRRADQLGKKVAPHGMATLTGRTHQGKKTCMRSEKNVPRGRSILYSPSAQSQEVPKKGGFVSGGRERSESFWSKAASGVEKMRCELNRKKEAGKKGRKLWRVFDGGRQEYPGTEGDLRKSSTLKMKRSVEKES